MTIKICLVGAAGRLGRALFEEIRAADDMQLTGAVLRAGQAGLGEDIGERLETGRAGVTATANFEDGMAEADIAIDASLPEASQRICEAAVKTGTALLTGVTGRNEEQAGALRRAASAVAVLEAGNFSLGVALAERLVREAAAALAEAEWDAEIHETHHRRKADAPSGTALMLGRAAAEGRGRDLDTVADWARHGQTGAREAGRIGFSVSRGGGVIGEHDVRFLAEMEEISISHKAHDRRVFARGALAAARWLNGRGPGLYAMSDVVGG